MGLDLIEFNWVEFISQLLEGVLHPGFPGTVTQTLHSPVGGAVHQDVPEELKLFLT